MSSLRTSVVPSERDGCRERSTGYGFGQAEDSKLACKMTSFIILTYFCHWQASRLRWRRARSPTGSTPELGVAGKRASVRHAKHVL
jgi:hypothetical protein